MYQIPAKYRGLLQQLAANPALLSATLQALEDGPAPCACRPAVEHLCVGDCDPDAYCACCLAECACPERPGLWLCRHQRDFCAGDEVIWPLLLLLSDQAAYSDPKPPTDVILTPNQEARIELMRKRVSRGEAVFEANQFDANSVLSLARAVLRGRNGRRTRDEDGRVVGASPTYTERQVRCG